MGNGPRRGDAALRRRVGRGDEEGHVGGALEGHVGGVWVRALIARGSVAASGDEGRGGVWDEAGRANGWERTSSRATGRGPCDGAV